MTEKELRDQIAFCMKCGNCMEVCPIYKETSEESSVARGKLALAELVLDGKAELTPRMEQLFNLCLSCKACTAKCPCGVKADELIIGARALANQRRGMHPIKKLIFTVLKQRSLFDLGLRMGGLFGGIPFKKLPGKFAVAQRLPMPGMDPNRIVAPMAAKPFRSQVPEVVNVHNPKKRVGFFTGCMINYMYTDVGQSVINVLKANNIEIVTPKLQHCCGCPVNVYGDTESAKTLGAHNLEIFEEANVDAVITACASCGDVWKKEYPHWFHGDAKYEKMAEKLAAKTYDISEFLVDVVPMKTDTLGEVQMKVTMHDPCHMARGQNVVKQPREVLKAIPGVEFVEMKEPARCCGGGGAFNMLHYDIASKVGSKKVKDIQGTGADTVATSCGTCRMQMLDSLHQNKASQDCVHVVQILDKAYQAGEKVKGSQKAG
jgi:glycolate oxidase iron-sulfur subunit